MVRSPSDFGPEPDRTPPDSPQGDGLGVDTGGTFTDFARIQSGMLRIEKRLSSPEDPARSILAGLEVLDPEARLPVIHGSTVATNALLERRGARTAFVTTEGFGDLLALGRGRRDDLYSLMPRPRQNLVPPEADLVVELAERVEASGLALRIPDQADMERAISALIERDAESVAVCLLFSFLEPAHERRFGQALAAHPRAPRHVSLSVDVLPELREYERASTTVVNAYVMPVMARYLGRLAQSAAPRRLAVMASHAGSLPLASAARLPVSTVLSGPAAGVLGAMAVAGRAGFRRLLCLDMGGTSTDVALCDGELPLSGESLIGGIPVHRPSVDVHTIGAGGGSLLDLDAAGGIQVGPRSAGALPGPAAYGRGGRQATLTDAHVVLGRLPEGSRLAGGVELDAEAARRAMAPMAESLGCSLETAALACLSVADAGMERALRQVSVMRGQDPAEFCLLPFGGAGGLHACSLAESIGADRMLLPAVPGALSALGLATAPPVATASRSIRPSSRLDLKRIAAIFTDLEAEACAQLGPSSDLGRSICRRFADLRYMGQSWELRLPWPADDDLAATFERAHQARYGFVRAGLPVELVTLRLRASAPAPAGLPGLLPSAEPSPTAISQRSVVLANGRRCDLPIVSRYMLRPGDRIQGPLILIQPDTTVFVAPAWAGQVGAHGDILLDRIATPDPSSACRSVTRNHAPSP